MLIFLAILFFVPIGIITYMIYVGILRRRRAFLPPPLSLDDDQAVILKMHRDAIEDRFRTRIELESFVNRLQWEMGNIGEVRKVDLDDDTATVIIMGESAEEIYAQIRKVMRHTSLSKNASVVLRYGPPGSRERRTHMAN